MANAGSPKKMLIIMEIDALINSLLNVVVFHKLGWSFLTK